jgi:hypothetical protein
MTIGNITQPNGYPLEDKNSKIYLLDIRSYTWVYTFEPFKPLNNTSSNPSTPSDPSTTGAKTTQISANDSESNNQLTKMKITIAAICGIFGTVILMTIGFFGYRWYQRRRIDNMQDEVLRVYGNHGNAT